MYDFCRTRIRAGIRLACPFSSASRGSTMRNNFAVCASMFVFGATALGQLSPPAFGQQTGTAVLTKDSVLRDPGIPALGNPKGDITIAEYFDYQCPYCKKVAPVLMRVAKADGKVRIVLKDWPIFGADSVYAAKMVLASKYQNKYAEAHDALINARGKLTPDRVRSLLQTSGIDVAKASDDLKSHEKEIEVLLYRNNSQAEAFGFQGTPAFIIGTFRVPGVLDENSFKQAIADARAAALK